MFRSIKSKFAVALAALMAISLLLLPQSPADAADHADGTIAASNPTADIADVFAFLDPNDNTKVEIAMDVDGFIVPSEAGNRGFFSPLVKFEFQIENSGTAKPDLLIDVTFSVPAAGTPQTGTVKFSDGKSFTFPTTVPSPTAPTAVPFTVTTDSKTGVSAFAGLTDDPFFFDIVGFDRFVASVEGGSADPTQLQRGRDSFAGYSIHMIALDVPVSMLTGKAGSKIGVSAATFVQKKTVLDGKGDFATGAAKFVQLDRMGNPAVNTALVPAAMKNEYNASTTADDAAGKFAPVLESSLMALGTNATNIGTLAGVAVTNGGDVLHLDTSIPNTTLGVGEKFGSTGFVGFPNGRRPGDDTISTILLLVTNEAIATGTNTPQNDVAFGTTFPYFANYHTPQPPGGSDGTQN